MRRFTVIRFKRFVSLLAMAFLSRTMKNWAPLPPSLSTAKCREIHTVSEDSRVKATFNPKERGILIQTPEPKDGLFTRARRQFVRRHGTTSNLINETERNMDFCSKKLRQYEYENFLCTLLLPEEARRGATAVRAFNIEIAQVLFWGVRPLSA